MGGQDAHPGDRDGRARHVAKERGHPPPRPDSPFWDRRRVLEPGPRVRSRESSLRIWGRAGWGLDDPVFRQFLDELLAQARRVVRLPDEVVVGHTREEVMAAGGKVLAGLELLPLQRDIAVLLDLRHPL